MKLFPLAIILILFSAEILAQALNSTRLDSLYNLFIETKTISHQQNQGIQSINPAHAKCGFGLAGEMRINYRNFSADKRKILDSLLARPFSDTSFVSPKGFFRIHFTKSDFPDYIPDSVKAKLTPVQIQSYKEIYLDLLGIALDSVYNFEVNYLGYPPPPSDDTAGGDNKYDVYIDKEQGYGTTQPENEITPGSGRFTSYIEMSDNFSGYFTNGIYAARVTVAHEFHHAIQIGNYTYRLDSDGFFYELTSTSMEHFVFPSIHDYYQYLPSYFNNSQWSLTTTTLPPAYQEYALAIWNIYLKEKFGYDIIKEQWQLMPQMQAVQAINETILLHNSSFGNEIANFGVWTYFTGKNAKPGLYFEDAADYPSIVPLRYLTLDSSLIIHASTHPLTNTFLAINNSSNGDNLSVIITNADVQSSLDDNSSYLPFEYDLYNFPAAGSSYLVKNYYTNFSADKPAFWQSGEILNNLIIRIGNSPITDLDYAFPSPFSYKNNKVVNIPVQPNGLDYADLYIYSVSMRLVYSANKPVASRNGKNVLLWNGMSINNQKLATGVYFYVVKSGDKVTKGKLVILNE